MTIAARIAALVGSGVTRTRALRGGDLSAVWQVDLANGNRLVAKQGPLARQEAAMLRAISSSGAPAPAVIACDDDLLVMDHVDHDGGPDTAWDDLACVLRSMHGTPGAAYGWDGDHAFGPVAIANARCAVWPDFWAQRRLLCHAPFIDAGLAARIGRLCARLHDVLPAAPTPALLHGDLWGGNVLARGNRIAALIDPACYHGDREVDAAMLTLFDHPPQRFFDALDLNPGWRERQPAYRLWPLLVHLRLFGNAYLGGVEACLDALPA